MSGSQMLEPTEIPSIEDMEVKQAAWSNRGHTNYKIAMEAFSISEQWNDLYKISCELDSPEALAAQRVAFDAVRVAETKYWRSVERRDGFC